MGLFSLTVPDIKVPLKILRDTGAKDEFILASVLPFSQDSFCTKPVCLVDCDVHIGVMTAFAYRWGRGDSGE